MSSDSRGNMLKGLAAQDRSSLGTSEPRRSRVAGAVLVTRGFTDEARFD
jgi:hypothetical protein